ncbi:MAG: hypothetical protein ACE5HC_11990 [Candidatus Binatia bacterium]
MENVSREEKFSFVLWMAKNILLAITLSLLVVAVICLIGGWMSLAEYTRGLKYAAVAVFVIGCVIFAATSTRTPIPGSTFNIRSSRPHFEHVNEHFRQRDKSLLFFLLSSVVAEVIYLVGHFLHRLT